MSCMLSLQTLASVPPFLLSPVVTAILYKAIGVLSFFFLLCRELDLLELAEGGLDLDPEGDLLCKVCVLHVHLLLVCIYFTYSV